MIQETRSVLSVLLASLHPDRLESLEMFLSPI